MSLLIIKLFIVFVLTIIITPFIIKLAFKINAVDMPKSRKVHTKTMPRLGGLSILIGFFTGVALIKPVDPYINAIIGGAVVIAIVGILDDLYELSAKWKLIGQLIASTIIVMSGLYVKVMNVPFVGQIDIGVWGIPLTFFWILAVTNSINLIDGLDGLAAGVSAIILATIVYLSMPGTGLVVQLALITIASIIGFLFFNFHPAKIFMGDVGALFLGYLISVLSLLEFKNVTFFSLIVPAIILAVPLSDTFFAIIRRLNNKTSISQADKSHLHHSFIKRGFTHLQAVLIIYSISISFSIAAILLSRATLWVSVLLIIIVLIAIEIMGEVLNLVGNNYKPITTIFTKITKIVDERKVK